MDATPLDALLPPPGGAPQNAPPLPAATTYTPIVTPGTMQYTTPTPASAAAAAPTPYVKYVLRSIVQYVSVFLAAFLLNLSQVQSLGLRYVPGAYTSGGVLSLTGAAVVAAATVILSYAVNAVLGPILV